MNIFVTDTCPVKSARALDDVRLNKMILETAQMLCTNARILAKHTSRTMNASAFATLDIELIPYKSTHENHPCTVWARANIGNYNWLASHFIALVKEKVGRTGKIHLSFEKLTPMLKHIYNGSGNTYMDLHLAIPVDNDISFVYAGDYPVRTTSGLDVTASYRKTMIAKWRNDTLKGRTPRWTNAVQPDWSSPCAR